jgi:hypothetical protein
VPPAHGGIVGIGLRARRLTRACSRQAGEGRGSARARGSLRPSSGSVDLCGRRHDRLQLMRKSLGSHEPRGVTKIMNRTAIGVALAATGFLAAVLLHLFAFLGTDLTEAMPNAYGPVLLLPVVVLVFFVVARRVEHAGLAVPDALRRVPGVAKIAGGCFIVYAVMTFGIIGPRLDNAHPTVVDGRSALQADHGGPVRLTTQATYHSQRAAQMRLLSLTLMIFYFGLGAYFFGAGRFVRQRQGQLGAPAA